MSVKKFYITTPIYYANDKPHIGHTNTTVFADILARWHRQKGEKVFFLVGTDEHGAKIESAASEARKTPKQFCDENVKAFKEAWKLLNISYDNFIRTTDARHKKAVGVALDVLYKKGLIYKNTYKGLYCRGCEQYKTDDDLVDGKCPDHQIEPEVMEEEGYFFRLSQFQSELERKISTDELKIEPETRKNEVLSFIHRGLHDISISRQNVKWGIPLPFSAEGGKKFTTYVWVDAFLNYLTGLGWNGNNLKTNKLKNLQTDFWPPDLQLMAKDILRVHATIWPALLLALELPLPKKLFIHGFITIQGQKMGKSLGNMIRPADLVEKFGIDGARYLIAAFLAHRHDSDISWEKMVEKYNADLANGLGNLVSRTVALSRKVKFKSSADRTKGISEKIRKLFKEARIAEVLEEIWKEINWANKYIEEKKLWELVKTDSNETREVLEELFVTIRDVAENLEPFMPETSPRIIKILETGETKKGEVLFPRV